ncbi:protein-tyrosine phosphatase-like protein, partial [Bombardia bombarda]
RPPSPPYIHVPSIIQDGESSMSIYPTLTGIDMDTGSSSSPSPNQLHNDQQHQQSQQELTAADLFNITQDRTQIATDRSHTWRYEQRREAQPITDFLYLGPASAIRDREFLVREGITMFLVVRESQLMGNFRNVQKTADEMGLEVEWIDVVGGQGMIKSFGAAIKAVNEHRGVMDGGEGDVRRRGKVLVCCETGNDRSPVVVAAYLMPMFGLDMIKAVQFVSLQRFCVNFENEQKSLLRAYEDILAARRDVSRARGSLRGGGPGGLQQPLASARSRSKRRIDDYMEVDEDEVDMGIHGGFENGDMERLVGRGFAPFIERD